MQVDIFGTLHKDEILIRTLGLYQPFATLMLHGKIETRWVLEGRTPPFPKGNYLFYSTKKICEPLQLLDWTGSRDRIRNIGQIVANDPTRDLRGWAIAVAELDSFAPLSKHEEERAHVKWIGTKVDSDGVRIQWALHFKNVKRIKPFEWKFGGQGVGRVPESEIDKIVIV